MWHVCNKILIYQTKLLDEKIESCVIIFKTIELFSVWNQNDQIKKHDNLSFKTYKRNSNYKKKCLKKYFHEILTKK